MLESGDPESLPFQLTAMDKTFLRFLRLKRTQSEGQDHLTIKADRRTGHGDFAQGQLRRDPGRPLLYAAQQQQRLDLPRDIIHRSQHYENGKEKESFGDIQGKNSDFCYRCIEGISERHAE